MQERFARVVLGGPRPRPAAAGRVQPPVQLDRAARLHRRRRAADAPRPGPHVHPDAASARRRRADAVRAGGRPVSPGRRRQDRGDDHRRERAAPARDGPQAGRGGARTTCSSSSLASGCSSTRRRGSWPPPARTSPARSAGGSSPARPPTTGTRIADDPLRVRADPVSPRDAGALRATTSSRKLRAMLDSARAAEGGSLTVKRLEKMVLLARSSSSRSSLDASKDAGISFEETGIDYVIVDEAHGYKNLATVSNIRDARDRRLKARHRPAHEARVAARAARPARSDDGDRDPDRQQHHRGARDAALPAPRPARRRRRRALRRVGGDVRPDRHRDRDGADRRRQLPHRTPGSPGSRTSPRCCACGTCSRTSRPPRTCDLPIPELAATGPTGERAAGDRRDPRRARRSPTTCASSPTAPSRSAPGRSCPRRTTCSRSPATAARPRSTCAWSPASAAPARASSRSPPRDIARDLARAPRPALQRPRHRRAAHRSPARCRSCSATSATPSEGWNAYDELRELLHRASACPATGSAFIHEARNDAEKGRLFAACRAGHVAVLIGSTEKMGVGTNIQAAGDRAAPSWTVRGGRPIIEQREGRILRQGNQNPRGRDLPLRRRAQLRRLLLADRRAQSEVHQPGHARPARRPRRSTTSATARSRYTEVKALASGDPLILDKAPADAEVTRLSRLERAWERNRQTLRGTLAPASGRADARERADRRGNRRARCAAPTPAATCSRSPSTASASASEKPRGSCSPQWAAAAQPGP